ncbi:MAG: choice-of-anchor Q domain-containing protein, partial [Chromatiales bacterium]
DPTAGLMIDPNFDPQYSQFCYTFQYMPGAITYLDTPVVSIAAFTTLGPQPVDCERPTNTPMVRLVTRTDDMGPYVEPGQSIRIESMGQVPVQNPEWDGMNVNQQYITRDYRFSPQRGAVLLEPSDGGAPIVVVPANNQWSQSTITATVPGSTLPGDYQVVVVNSAQSGGAESPIGVTLTVGDGTETVTRVTPATWPNTPIQDAIDAAAPGELILVEPGSSDELVIMWKPVKLQGWGAGSVFINARQVPTEKIQAWRTKAEALVGDLSIDLLPGQEVLEGFGALAGAVLPTEEGAGILVAGKADGPNSFAANPGARIDGFTIVGASTGGGIVANGYNEGLSIGNNRLTANSGFFGGGIRIGHPTLVNEDLVDGLIYTDAMNDNVRLHHNHVAKNGGMGGAGGGISLHTGADGYQVQKNWVCGNFTQGDGAGIGHLGLSDGGLIEDNFVIFNESFSQASAQAGGGVFVGGQAPLDIGLLSPGSGNVTIDANVIRGNNAGAGDGGGLRLAAVNGQDVADSMNEDNWYGVSVFNNMITNNVAGLAGGGISLQDALKVSIRNNTVANNDSTATTAEAFTPGIPNVTNPQPAGIVSRNHSVDLAAFVPMGLPIFSDPELLDNIVWHNRSFYWTNYDDPATAVIEAGLVPATCGTPTDPLNDPTCDGTLVAVDDYSVDLAVLPAGTLNPMYSLLTDTTGYDASNISGDPLFVNGYLNGTRGSLNIGEFTTLATAAAFDEGGNFIQVSFGPLSLVEPDDNPNNLENGLFDYHLGGGSPAIDADGVTLVGGRLAEDIDNDPRPQGSGIDIGADEAQ